MDSELENRTRQIEERLGKLEAGLAALQDAKEAKDAPGRSPWRWASRIVLLTAIAGLALAMGVGVRWGVQAQSDGGSPAPGVMNYQGQLTDAVGNPLNGNADITFRLYDVSEGGTPLWTEAHTGANAVLVSSGLFSTLLGSIEPIPPEIMGSSPLYLGITVGSDAEMIPRQPVSSVAYALVANDVADGAITTSKLAESAVTRDKLAAVTRVKELVRIGSVNMNLGDDYHPPSSTSRNYFFMQVPDDYVSGGLTIKLMYRSHGADGGRVVLRFDSYRMRDGVAGTIVDSGLNRDVVPSDTNDHSVTLTTIPDSSFEAGDIIRVTIMRLGDDPGDTNGTGFVDSGVWAEYLGRS